jgi:hypothetical protein
MKSSGELKLRGAGATGSWSMEHRSYQELELRGAGATGSWSDGELERQRYTEAGAAEDTSHKLKEDTSIEDY